MSTSKWKFQGRFISLWMFLITWKNHRLTSNGNSKLEQDPKSPKRKKSLIEETVSFSLPFYSPVLEHKANYLVGQGSGPCSSSVILSLPTRLPISMDSEMQSRGQSRGWFIAFNYFGLKVSSGAQARNILYFPLPGANVKHTWKTHFMLRTY